MNNFAWFWVMVMVLIICETITNTSRTNYDLNTDGKVDIVDISILSAHTDK